MELTVYRQASKTRPDGTVVYKGEDARPLVGKDFLLVADGLGGASAIRHKKFDIALFDCDKLMDTLFSGIYEDYGNEEFTAYVKNSFYELFAVKDCYYDNVYNIKKSGYFASRIVSAIVLHEILYNEEVSAAHLFEKIHNAGEEARAAVISGIGERFTKKIKADLCAIADKVNLIYESSYSGLALLGTTLCVTIFLENENEVEVLYLTAGDSRPYFWNSEGLRQVVADQEGKDGGMTNYIRANGDFSVSSEYFVFPKPCVLFNTSDGCFDSHLFSVSQLAFEKHILTAITNSESIDGAAERLYTTFLEHGTHDDSSTMALRTFGYEDYEQLKNEASGRLSFIDEKYLAPLPDLLERDYIAETEECEKTYPQKLATVKLKLEQEKRVGEYCEAIVKSGGYQPYTVAAAEIEAKIEAERLSLTEAHGSIRELIANNYIQFLAAFENEQKSKDRKIVRKISEIEDKRRKYASDYMTKLEEQVTSFDRTASSLKELLDGIYSIGVPEGFEDYDEAGLEAVDGCEALMTSLFDYFEKLRKRKLDAVNRISYERNEYTEKNRRMALDKAEEERYQRICAMIVHEELPLDGLELYSKDKARLSELIRRVSEIKGRIARLGREDKSAALESFTKKFWDGNYVSIIMALIDKKSDIVSPELLSEAEDTICRLRAVFEELKKASEIQTELLKKYNEVYYQFMGGYKA